MTYPIQKLTKEFEHNGVKYTAKITITDDYDDLHFDYGDAEENAKEQARIDSGEVEGHLINVDAELFGVVGFSVLGGVWVDTKAKESTDEQLMYVVKTECMIEDAIDQLKQKLQSRAKDLQPFA